MTGRMRHFGSTADVEANQRYRADVQTASLDALQTGALDAIAAQTVHAHPRLLFDTYVDELVSACEAEVVPMWAGRLSGVDDFSADLCHEIIESLRID